MKIFLALLLTLTGLFVISGCGGNKTCYPPLPPARATVYQAETPPPPPPVVNQPVGFCNPCAGF